MRDEYRYDWWALELRPYLTDAEMLTAEPHGDWPVEFFDWEQVSASGVWVATTDGAEKRYVPPQYIKKLRLPHAEERERKICQLNGYLGMVQGKLLITGRGPTEKGRNVPVAWLGFDVLQRLVTMAEEYNKQTGVSLDDGTAWLPTMPPLLAYQRGFLWIALTAIDWIVEPGEEGMRTSQLNAIKAILQKKAKGAT